jgi:hypothetical protein
MGNEAMAGQAEWQAEEGRNPRQRSGDRGRPEGLHAEELPVPQGRRAPETRPALKKNLVEGKGFCALAGEAGLATLWRAGGRTAEMDGFEGLVSGSKVMERLGEFCKGGGWLVAGDDQSCSVRQ